MANLIPVSVENIVIKCSKKKKKKMLFEMQKLSLEREGRSQK